MSFWNNIFSRSAATPLQAAVSAEREARSVGTVVSTEETSPSLLAGIMGAYTSAGGVAVTEASALAISAVWACVNNISQDIAALPVHVYQDTAAGRDKISTHPVRKLLNKRANARQNAFSFRQTMMATVLLHGKAYARIERDGRQQPIGLHYKHPGKTTVTEYDGRLWYKFEGDAKTYADYDVLHFRGLSLSGIEGLSPLHAHRETFGRGLASQRSAAAFYKNGARMSGVLTTEQQFKNPDTAQKLGGQFTALYGGAENTGKTVVLEGGLKYQAISLPPADAQYVEEAKLTVQDVARIYRMPPHKIGDLERSTNNNIEHQGLDYVQSTLMPWLVMEEQEYNLKLFRVVEQETHEVKHNLSALMRADATARANYYSKMIQNGVYSINMVLALEDQNGIGPDGDRRYLQGAMVPIDRLDSMIDNKQTAPAAPGNEQNPTP